MIPSKTATTEKPFLSLMLYNADATSLLSPMCGFVSVTRQDATEEGVALYFAAVCAGDGKIVARYVMSSPEAALRLCVEAMVKVATAD